jgi:hypothetical protein
MVSCTESRYLSKEDQSLELIFAASRLAGRFERRVDPLHFAGVVGFRERTAAAAAPAPDVAAPELLSKHAVSTAGQVIRALCCSPARGPRRVGRR